MTNYQDEILNKYLHHIVVLLTIFWVAKVIYSAFTFPLECLFIKDELLYTAMIELMNITVVYVREYDTDKNN